MRRPSHSTQFERDVRLAEKRGKDMTRLRKVLSLLIDGEALPQRYRDHALKGQWSGYRDLYIEPDWVLIYRLDTDAVRFERTGTHSDLFKL